MNSQQVLRTAIRLINKHGLAVGRGSDEEGHICTAVALVGGAKEGDRFRDAPYLDARRQLCNSLGIAPNYQAIVDWNDAFTVKRDVHGKPMKIFNRTAAEVIAALTKAVEETEVETA